MTLFDTAAIAFTTFFATVAPIDITGIFTAMTAENTAQERRAMAIRGTFIATIILIIICIFGDALLTQLHISLASLKTAGGILLLLMGIDMVFLKETSGRSRSTTVTENKEAHQKNDISVFPLATPLIAGPGTMGAGILLFANAQGNIALQATVLGALLGVLALTLFLLLSANYIHRWLGVTGLNVIARILGVLLRWNQRKRVSLKHPMATLTGKVIEGDRVASGLNPDTPYPAGSIELQAPFFYQLGLDLSCYHLATLNISIEPKHFKIIEPDHNFQQVNWTSVVPAETFLFVQCQLSFHEKNYHVWL